MRVAVAGSGGWGTALALLLAEGGHSVTLRSHTQEESRVLRDTRENPLLPGVLLPETIEYTADIAAVRGADFVVLAAPSFAVRETAGLLRDRLPPDAILISVAKGLEKETSLRLSQVIREVTGDKFPVVVLTGPSHAEEVARGIPTGCVAACESQAAAEAVQDLFMSERFRVYSSPDPVGAEFGAALKNVMALCAGVCTGLGYGDNTKAMLMTRGLTEIARLGVALGGRKETFAGLAGMGDLIVTCTSLNSRNNRAGILIGQGMAVPDAVASIGAVVEGYYAVESAHLFAKKIGVEMPITEAAYRVLYEGAEPRSVIHELMVRRKTHESEQHWIDN